MYASLLMVAVATLAADPALEVTLKKPADRATIATKDDVTTVKITSSIGIGGATIKFPEKDIPKALRIELELKGLEGFSIASGKKRLSNPLGSEMPELFEVDATGKSSPIKVDDKLKLKIEKKGEKLIVVDVPATWWEGANRSLTIEWIDFYRR